MRRLPAFLLLLFCISTLTLAQESEWTPEMSMKVKNVNGTAISPDGKFMAYVVRTPLMKGEKSEYNSQIWVAAKDGAFNEQYTRGEKSATSPSFSPDGKKIAFLSSRGGKNQVWLMRVFGGEPEQISTAEAGVSSFQWSPDGNTIAYTMRDPQTAEEKKAKKEKTDVILVDKNFKYNHLYTVKLEKDEEGKRASVRLTEGHFTVNSFDWSPDGSQIVFDHQEDTNINTGFMNTDISMVPADSGRMVTIVDQPGADRSPKFSPDGKSIAFVSHGGQPEPIGLGDLFIVEASGAKMRQLMETPNRSANLIDWTPDGKNLIITENVGTNSHVISIPTSGRKATVITSGDLNFSGDRPALITKSSSGTFRSVVFDKGMQNMAYSYQNLDTPAEIYTSSVNNFESKQISHVNDALDLPPLAKTELITWKSKDGLLIEGLLTYPADYEKGKRYPVILQIHGGPGGVFSQDYNGRPGIYMGEYFAQKGYAIIKPNPRGSTGYGKEFRYANFKDWGFGDFDDVTTGVDKVIEMGIGDVDKQFVMGWSYGGYLTSFVVTKTNRFKAASMGAGLPNLVSMVTTTDIQDYLVGHLGGEFFDDYKTYEKHSAIYQIKGMETPTQVIHGANDLRVPFTQGQEFYRALKRLGVDTEMVVYPRTPHGPREPKFLMDVSDRILTWFETYKD